MSPLASDSFSDLISPVARSIAPGLISPEVLGSISNLAQGLPATFGLNTYGFECPLGEDSATADFLLRVTAAIGRDELHAAAERKASSDARWSQICRFADAWLNCRPPFNAIDNVWLEFDTSGPNPEVPGAFFGFRPPFDTIRAAPTLTQKARLNAACAALMLLSSDEARGGDPDRRPAPDLLRKAFDEARDAGEIFQVGLMLSRPTWHTRLCLRLKSFDSGLKYLDALGWRGNRFAFRSCFEPLSFLANYVCLDVDLTSSLQSKVGMEFYMSDLVGWRRLVDRLVNDQLCTPNKRNLLQRYPGLVTNHAPAVPWPSTLTQAAEVIGFRWSSVFVKSLHHVKVVLHDDGFTEAKAYLAVNHRWI